MSHIIPSPHVLIVEDEPRLRMLVADNLEYEGYRVSTVESAEDALRRIQKDCPSLVILDVMLPKMNGFELCQVLRREGVQVPIIMLTAKGSARDRVSGLDLGADDYVPKPFSVRELLARVRVQLRRGANAGGQRDHYAFGEVRVFARKRLVTRRDKRVELSPREFDVLLYLLTHRGEVVTREQLLRDVWGYSQDSVTRTVDNFIAKLRLQLEPRHHDPQHIITVHGIGYQLLADGE